MSTSPKSSAVFDKRVDIVMFTSSVWSLLQGDPDSDNSRRIDPDTMQGVVTPQGIKRKIRYYVESQGHDLYVCSGPTLESKLKPIVDQCRDQLAKASKSAGKKGEDKVLSDEHIRAVVQQNCKRYFDTRAFGAVLTSPVNAPVTGPVQVGFSLSEEPIVSETVCVTRCVVTKETDAAAKNRDMGVMRVVPWEVSRSIISIDPYRAKTTGFTYGDYDLILQALSRMYDMTRSTLRSGVTAEQMVVFTHESPMGNMQTLKLNRRVKLVLDPEVQAQLDEGAPVKRSYSQYKLSVDTKGLKGITTEIVDL